MTYKFETTSERSRLMSKIRSTGTIPEIHLRKSLWSKGYRYRKNNKSLPGKPDITFAKYKIAVFIDGEFWHGFNWEDKKGKIKSNRDYWIPKIERNMVRDKKNNLLLEQSGWKVIRFWEKEVKKDIAKCSNIIIKTIEDRKNGKI